jgi:hypothetical protein
MTSADDSRRKVADLALLHAELEPQLRDVYVEGRSDQQFFRWFFREAGIPVSGVYAIDDRAHVPSEQVLAAGAEVGPRGRVVALAHAASDWGMEKPGVTCIVDADRSLIVPELVVPDLFYTDYAAIEGYLFQPRPLEQLLRLVIGSDADANGVIEVMTPMLNDLYVVRAVLHLEGPNVPLIDKFYRCCRRHRGAWMVDVEDLIARSLAPLGRSSDRERLVAKFAEYRLKVSEPTLSVVRGHDIAPMLIRELDLKNDLAKPAILEQAWRGCLNLADLDTQPLFQALRARLT